VLAKIEGDNNAWAVARLADAYYTQAILATNPASAFDM
jgi:hypothetical protein